MRHAARLISLLLFILIAAPIQAQGKRPMTVDDLFRFKRVADPQISPDGKWVVYTLTTVDLGGNKTQTNLWLAPTAAGQPRQLTTSPKHDRHPRWSPDGSQILFESDRGGNTQLWVIGLNGGEARQLTTISTEAGNGIWSPDGKSIAFVSAVWPEYSDKPFAESDALNKKRAEEIEKSPVKAKVFTKLFYRHWDDWVEDKRQHLFVMAAGGGEPKDVTPGDRDANPTSDTFSIGDDFTFSPDGSHLVFTAPPARDEAWSTNYDILRVPVAGGSAETLTKNEAADGGPRFSPDGKRLLYRAQKRPGFEADHWQLTIVDCDPSGAFVGQPRALAGQDEPSAESYIWHGNDALVFTGEWAGATRMLTLDPVSTSNNNAAQTSAEGTNSTPSYSSASRHLVFSNALINRPPEVLIYENGGPTPRNLSHANDAVLEEMYPCRPESVDVTVEGGKMQMWILKPPGFDPTKKWPLAFLVHGGPQGAWTDGWSYRWCPKLWAAQGYVVALPNPRGSTGFGQKFVDDISGDWGGKCYDDLMAGLTYLEKQPYIDTDRMAAAGASFGGYMMNWFQGHTTKFKTLITHCGVYNFDSMYATTDEVWFDEWEHGGPPWLKRESYEKHSPHRFAQNFKTPMLIIHNDRDFRVPLSEGMQLFNTLQRLGVPSKFINFPDEGHWVLKPANSAYWHKEVFAWLKKYAPPGARP
jgi:dipeptidyl aminopeptidase/acylaminoacyl peptidase